jgi:hypothetical protein
VAVIATFASCSWQTVSPSTLDWRVWGSGPSDVWITTGSHSFKHWDGSTLQVGAPAGVFGTVGIFGYGPNDVWIAGGNGGTVDHWDGTSWAKPLLPFADAGGSFYSLWGSSANDLWAVGRVYFSSLSAVSHFDGVTWSDHVPFPFTFQLNGVWGTGASDVWAVGINGIYHRGGAGWAQVAGVTGAFNAIWGSAADDVWAVGDAGAVLHWNGTTWTSVSSGVSASLTGVWGSAPNDVWVVGDAGTLLRWDGGRWVTVPSGTSAPLSGVWGAAANDVWAVGNALLHYHP